MLFLTRWFGVTASDAERDLASEKSEIDEIVQKVLLLQTSLPTSNSGRCAGELTPRAFALGAQFEVFDVYRRSRRRAGRAPRERNLSPSPASYPAIVRFGERRSES